MSWSPETLSYFCTLRDALDDMEHKRLIKGKFSKGNDCCAMRAYADFVSPEVKPVGMNTLMADEIGVSVLFLSMVVGENDRDYGDETPEERWQRMRKWVDEQLQEVV